MNKTVKKQNRPSGLVKTDTIIDALRRADTLSDPSGCRYSGSMTTNKDLRRIVLLAREYRYLVDHIESKRGKENVMDVGWAVEVNRKDGSTFLALGGIGTVPVVWHGGCNRKYAVQYKKVLIGNGFKCRVVKVEYVHPISLPNKSLHRTANSQ